MCLFSQPTVIAVPVDPVSLTWLVEPNGKWNGLFFSEYMFSTPSFPIVIVIVIVVSFLIYSPLEINDNRHAWNELKGTDESKAKLQYIQVVQQTFSPKSMESSAPGLPLLIIS